MKIATYIVSSLVAVASMQLASAGDVVGKVTLKGDAPPDQPIALFKENPQCSPLNPAGIKTRFYVVGPGKELADVVVYIKDAPKGGAANTKPVMLDQINCEYQPYVFAMQTQEPLVVKNSDNLMHNINRTSKTAKPFNQAQMGKGPDLNMTFAEPEMFMKFECNVHPWMFSYVSIFDHPYFAVTSKDGSFKIPNLPPGKYTIEAIHRKAGKTSQEITVGADAKTVDLVLEVPAPAK